MFKFNNPAHLLGSNEAERHNNGKLFPFKICFLMGSRLLSGWKSVPLIHSAWRAGYPDSSVPCTVAFVRTKAETVNNRLDPKIDSIHTAKESKQEKGSKHASCHQKWIEEAAPHA